ncbi:hypothetical protein BGZ74_005839 [Mortierella antarctica]|nr:hypothetical protein BGZ74_005839 [Mortierella antarctica]
MYPNQTGGIFDKENATEPSPSTTTSGAPSLVKQASSLMTPSAKQPLKMGLTRTPSQQGKMTSSAVSSPFGLGQSVLRAKTNLQHPPPTGDDSLKATGKKPSNLARTFSALEANPFSPSDSPDISASKDDRRRSITKRGSAKSRLIIHRDEPSPTPATPTEPVAEAPSRSQASPVKEAAPVLLKSASSLETTTTQLSINRALESYDKVVVGAAETQTKRRALTNDEEKLEIEYCPPPVPEQLYDPGFEIDYSVFEYMPNPLAYQLRTIDQFEIGPPSFDPAPIDRHRPHKTDKDQSNEEEEEEVAIPTVTIADGKFDVTWSTEGTDLKDHNDGNVHPEGDHLFGIKDLHDESKLRPPFDGFIFELEASDDSLSSDEDDILGKKMGSTLPKAGEEKVFRAVDKKKGEFNEALGLEDLEDESKVQAPFSDFAFAL